MSTSPLIPDAAARQGNDPIFALNGEASRRAKAGESIVNATLGALLKDDGTLAVMETVAEAMARVPHERAAAYAPISGPPPFLKAVVGDLFGDGPLAGQAVAVATVGSTGAIHHAFQSFLEAGQDALAPSFYWGPYLTIATHAGRGVGTFRMFGDDLRFDLDAFEAGLRDQVARQGRALLLFNFPCNNPTGYSLDDGEWAAVADVVARVGAEAPVTLLVDHAYAKFGPEGSDAWVAHVPRMLESATVLVAWTASKSFANYGGRVGALVALHRDGAERERMAAALGYSCRATWSNGNNLGMLATTELLTDPDLRRRSDEEREGLIRLLDERVDVFNGAAGDHDRLRYPRYEGGFFVSVLTEDGERTAAAMRDAGVFVVPIGGAVRVALCATPAAVVPRVVDALAEGVAAAGVR